MFGAKQGRIEQEIDGIIDKLNEAQLKFNDIPNFREQPILDQIETIIGQQKAQLIKLKKLSQAIHKLVSEQL